MLRPGLTFTEQVSPSYQPVREANLFGLRNRKTGQIDHSGFADKQMLRDFLFLHYGERLTPIAWL